MKTLKPLSYLTLPTTFIYLAATLFTAYQYYHVAKAFTTYGITGDILAEFLEPYILAGIVFFLFFIFGLIISYGLSRNGRWALHGWFTLLVCFLVFHLYRLITGLDGLPYTIVERVFEILCVLMLAVITFMIMKLAGAQAETTPPPPPEQWNTTDATDVS
jgi:hypothetical protein